MASRKRASMREGPLAALFRKTEDEGRRSPEERPSRARAGAREAPSPSARARRAPAPAGPSAAAGAEPTSADRSRRPRERLRHVFSLRASRTNILEPPGAALRGAPTAARLARA